MAPSCWRLVFPGYSLGWYPHPVNYSPGTSVMVVKATAPPPPPSPHLTVRMGFLDLRGNRPRIRAHVAASWRAPRDTNENLAFQGGCEVWQYLCRLVSTWPTNYRHALNNLDRGPQPRAMDKVWSRHLLSQAAHSRGEWWTSFLHNIM